MSIYIDEAVRRLNEAYATRYGSSKGIFEPEHVASKAFAAALEELGWQPPRDPLWEEAVELVVSEDIARTSSQIAAIREGRAGKEKVGLALRALRRGMALREGAGQ